MELEWARLKASELRTLAQQDAIVLVPVAAMEHHGPHLPVMVDSLLCAEVALRAARRVPAREPAVVAPTVWSGLSEHHMPFGGTFTLETDQVFVPAERSRRSRDRRPLGLRIYRVDVKSASASDVR